MYRLNLKSSFVAIMTIALLTAFVSEIKVMPFDNAPFRFGLGSIAFFLAILIKPVPIVLTGIVTGTTVVLFRAIIDLVYLHHQFSHALLEHLPAALFYICFALCLSRINLDQLKTRPLALGLFGALFEIFANFIEQVLYMLLQIHQFVMTESFLLLIIVAFLRNFFVVGLYSAISIQEQKKQLEYLLTFNSDLYVEALYLQKSIDQIESLTSDSFQLYKQLKQLDRSASFEALRISQEIHELKKDTARIYAGLSKIVTVQTNELYQLETLLQYVASTNRKYSEYLQKQIIINTLCSTPLVTNKQLAILAILNNLVSNAVEAIEENGEITVVAQTEKGQLQLLVTNNGPRIEPHILPVIFEPGYTSKFKEDGFASTGIGLSHVQAVVERLQGNIIVTSESLTTFTITIPIQHLI